MFKFFKNKFFVIDRIEHSLFEGYLVRKKIQIYQKVYVDIGKFWTFKQNDLKFKNVQKQVQIRLKCIWFDAIGLVEQTCEIIWRLIGQK